MVVVTCGCHREPAGKVAPPPAFTRGELVVVERAAADFFEARVLSVSKESLKLQTTAEGDPVTVALNDAYRLPKAPQVFLPGSSAICGAAPSRWVPCKVIHSGATAMEVELANGDRRSLAAERLIRPGPVTVLDIDRHFELLAARKRFGETALAAGHPRRPSGWRPVPHEPILARRGHDWYAAHAVQLLADGGESVVWETSGRAEALPGSYVVPAPPFEHTFARGDFALVRSSTPGTPWERVSVEGVGPDSATIVGADGERRRVDVHGLVPLASSQ